MSKDKNNLFLFIGLSLIISLLTYKIIKEKSLTTYKAIELTSTNKIYNLGTDKMLDTMLVVGLRAYEIKNIEIGIRYLTNETKLKSLLTGYVNSEGNLYLLTIKKTNKEESFRIMAHELTHIKQLYDERVSLKNDTVIWLGQKIINLPEYNKRPWEIEAYQKEDSLINILKNTKK